MVFGKALAAGLWSGYPRLAPCGSLNQQLQMPKLLIQGGAVQLGGRFTRRWPRAGETANALQSNSKTHRRLRCLFVGLGGLKPAPTERLIGVDDGA